MLGKKVLWISTAMGGLMLTIGVAAIWVNIHKYVLTGLVVILILLLYWLIKLFVQQMVALEKLSQTLNENKEPVTWQMPGARIVSNIKLMYMRMREMMDFVQSGDTNFNFNYISPESHMGKVLQEYIQKQKRLTDEEYKRNWVNEGLARFGELLRVDGQDLKEHTQKILSSLVKYLDVNQGGFFIEYSEEDTSYMVLSAAYAYDRKKFIEARVEAGQGLLGQVMLEKDIIYLTDVPGDFVNITSGLGEATPRNIVIIPLMNNEIFYGAIELASFEVLEDYKMAFLKEVAGNIASMVAAVKTNEHTRQLLEQAQQMSHELQSQEEEMRQNMEELQATQEEMKRNEMELSGLFTALDTAQGLAEIDAQGSLVSVNNKLQQIVGYNEEELTGKIRLFMPDDDESWKKLRQGQNVSAELLRTNKQGKDIWLDVSYSPVINENGDIKKVLMLAIDITARKQREKDVERLSLVADNTNNAVIITDAFGLVEYVNPGFTKLTGYSLKEVIGKKPGHILQGPETNQETVERIRGKLAAKQPLHEEILNYNKEGESYWISLTINPVFDENGGLEKFISIQSDITQTKENALDHHYKLEAIGRANAMIEFDTEGTILEVNDNFLKIFKYTREELIGQKHKLFIIPETYDPEAYERFWNSLREGQFIDQEFKRIDRYGKEIWLKCVYNPILNLNGEVTKIIKFAVDITREKELYLQNEKQQAEIKSHLETIDKTIASLEFDSTGKINYVNRVFLDISGYEEEELIGKHYDYLLPKEEIDKPQTQMMWSSLKEGNYFTGQFKQQSKSGKALWLRGTFNPILDDYGAPERIMLFAQFNTQEMAQKEDLSQIVKALKRSTLVVEINTDGTFKNANVRFFDEFGYSRMDLRQKPISHLLDKDMSKRKLASLTKKFNNIEFFEEVLTFVNKEGDKKTFRVSLNPIRNMEDEIVKIVAILTDEASVLKLSPN